MTQRAKILVLVALLALLAAVLLRSGPSAPAASAVAPSAPGGGAARRFARGTEKVVTPDQIPGIDVAAFRSPSERPDAVERNIFRFHEPPPPRRPGPRAEPAPVMPGDPRFIGPLPPPPPPPPPQPPAIPFQFTGTFGDRTDPVAVLVEGDRLLLAREGDVVDGSFVIRHVGYESLDVAFVGFPESDVRRLPITPANKKS